MARLDVLFLSVLIATISIVASAQNCQYTINVQTGTRKDSGTDSIIGVVLADKDGEYIEIKDLVNWGGTTPGRDYFENGNLDIFTGTERCLPNPVCFMKLSSDNSGNKSGWYAEYVKVTTSKTGSASKTQQFTVAQWLALSELPYQLYAERNNCPSVIKKGAYAYSIA
ncbi:PLAT/LH2 domain-containing protein [Hirschfeldia incana]|nr:PLAT/LH2 domain-containing protein [Hirschfeldia incana]